MRQMPSLIVIAVLVVLQACGDDSSNNDSSGDTSSDGATEAVDSITVDVDNLTFDALAAGPEDGELVLLLHGFPQTSAAFEAQVATLGDVGYRAVAPDQRGYSPEARPTEVEEYQLENLVDDVLGMADSLGADQFHLVGHNFGGLVAWHVAATEPDRLSSLAALSIPHPDPLAAWVADIGGVEDVDALNDFLQIFEFEGLEEQLTANDAALLRSTFMSSTAMPVDSQAPYLELLGTPEALTGALNWFRAMDHTILEGLDPVATPTLYIWATGDIVDQAIAETTEDHVDTDYCFQVLDGVSHWIPEEAPEALSELLLDHLDGSGC